MRIELEQSFNTTPEHLWELIVDPGHYRFWTKAFSQGSKFVGDWSQGSNIRFVMEDEAGNESGMLSMIEVSEWPTHISIKHLGLVMNGIEDYDSEEARQWTPAYENYTFISSQEGQCIFKMAQDIPEAYEEEFVENWNHAFELIKQRLEILPSLKYKITLETQSKHNPEELWKKLTEPELVKTWNFASPDWGCPNAENDLKVGGEFHYEMAAKDGSMSFDFWGTYTKIEENKTLEFNLGDGRKVSIELIKKPWGCIVVESFEPEQENSLHLQRQGWQAILNNLAK
jgi:uncharacterized protein YndB with AHSA1/START domain